MKNIFKRQNKGIPAGGQFAADRKAEPSGSLAEAPLPETLALKTNEGADLDVSGLGSLSSFNHWQVSRIAQEMAEHDMGGALHPAEDYAQSHSLEWTSPTGNVITMSQLGTVYSTISYGGEVKAKYYEDDQAGPQAFEAKNVDDDANEMRAWDSLGIQSDPSVQVSSVGTSHGLLRLSGQTTDGMRFAIHQNNSGARWCSILPKGAETWEKSKTDEAGMKGCARLILGSKSEDATDELFAALVKARANKEHLLAGEL